jgi:hypothetical protein
MSGKQSTENTAKQQRGTPFQKGQSGNPNGRPVGSRNATTLAMEAMLDGQAKTLTQKAIDMALAGDMQAIKLCIDRMLPPRRDVPVCFELPELKLSADIAAATSSVLKVVAAGELTLTEAAELSRIIQSFARAAETAELEERIRRLEQECQNDAKG